MRYPVFLVDVLTDGLQLGTGWQSGVRAGLLYRSQQLTVHLNTQTRQLISNIIALKNIQYLTSLVIHIIKLIDM